MKTIDEDPHFPRESPQSEHQLPLVPLLLTVSKTSSLCKLVTPLKKAKCLLGVRHTDHASVEISNVFIIKCSRN